jgi:hypothetical protein
MSDPVLKAIIGEDREDEKTIDEMESEYNECAKQCKAMRKQIDELKAGNPYDFELKNDAKLIDLFNNIVLYPGKDWKERIIKLIDIRHDVQKPRLSGPSYFEALFQLAFFLGIFPEISEYKRQFYKKKTEPEPNFLYETSVESGGGKEQGISDITFKLLPKSSTSDQNKLETYACGEIPVVKEVETNTTYYVSVKRYTKEKSPKYYDIGELYTFISKKAPNTNFKLCICCKDQEEFLKRMNASRSDYLVNSVNKPYGFIDQKDGKGLLQLFEAKRNEIFSNMAISTEITESSIEKWTKENYPPKVQIKDNLALYFHQELIVESVIKRIEDQKKEIDKDKYTCIGVLPRGGKSYIAGGIIKKILSKHKEGRFWVLFMTSAVSETMSQFKEDLIEKFADFKDFDFVHLRDWTKKNPYKPQAKNSFVFVSRELLTGPKKEDENMKIGDEIFNKIFERLGFQNGKKVPFNLVMFDEAHRGGITDRTRAALNEHIIGKPPFVLMTATYKKLADDERGYIKAVEDLFIWDIEDIQLMKKLPILGIERFKEGEYNEFRQLKKFGLFNRYDEKLIVDILNRRVSLGQSLESIVKPYNNFPEPLFLSATFHPKVVEQLKLHQNSGGSEGFNIKEHFEHKSLLDKDTKELLEDKYRWQEWYKILKNIPKAIALRSYLTPNDNGAMLDSNGPKVEIKIDDKEKLLNRMFAYSQKKMGVNARPSYGTPFSIIMFLPTGEPGQRIGATSRAWGSLLLNSKYWYDNFVVLGLSEFKIDDEKALKKEEESAKQIKISFAESDEGIEEVQSNNEEKLNKSGGYYTLSVMSGGFLKEDKDKKCLQRSELWPYCSEEEIEHKDLKSKIMAIEQAALKERKGLVILTGQRAAMGISLPCVDLVCLLDDDKEADMIIQKMYRALTDSPGKKYGFIFDLNVRRIFEAKFAYANTINFSAKGAERKTVGQIADNIFNTCLWDSDAWHSKEPTQTFNDYMLEIKRKLLGDIETSIYKQYEKDIEVKDVQLIDNSELVGGLGDILSGKPILRKGNKQVLQEPDEDAAPSPGEDAEAMAQKAKAEAEAAKKTAEEGKDGTNAEALNKAAEEAALKAKEAAKEAAEELKKKEDAKKRLAQITKQFVNLLYVRTFPNNIAEGKALLAQLLEIYDDDKEKAKGKNLLSINSCDAETNLYIRLLQDLENFVPVPELVWYETGIPYVGPPKIEGKHKDRFEDYLKIPNGTRLFLTIPKKGIQLEAVFHLWAKKSINTWAKNNSGWKEINTWVAIKTKDKSGTFVTLDNFVKSTDVTNDDKGIELPLGMLNEHKRRVSMMLDHVRNRFGDFNKAQPNETYFIYSNYLESFMSSLTKESINIQSGGFISSTKRYNTILQEIEDHLVPDDTARKQRGEIFTPPDLVREMLYGLSKSEFVKNKTKLFGLNEQKLYEYQDDLERVGGLPESVWKNPNLKWLDPANGIGNFPIIAFYKLDYSLKLIGKKKLDTGETVDFADADERRKHIIENMLFMIELDRGNVDTSRALFKKIHPGAKPNILCGDTLGMTYDEILAGFRKLNKKLDGLKFDVIMGNPPFNPPKTDTGSSGNSIWQNFVIKSFSILNENGYLVFVHPPGWKKPTESEFDEEKFPDGSHYKQDKTGKTTIKQIRQGAVWQILRDTGVFKFIYTNDQKGKSLEHLEFFPAVDYYVYQKTNNKFTCDAKNIFMGETANSTSVKLNYKLDYLPNLITKQTQDILHKVTSKEGEKPDFSRGIDERGITWEGKSIDWLYDSNKSGFQYKKHGKTALTKSGKAKETVDIDKIVLNFGGGINAYNVKYVSKGDEVGVLDKTMYSEVESDKNGKRLEAFFKSDIVKFIFLITQYASGAITQNEPIVANSITIPPEGISDYYKFFDIEEHKEYIEKLLKEYQAFSAPKDKTRKTKAVKGGERSFKTIFNKTRKHRRT